MKKIFTAAFASIILLAGIGTMAIAKTSAKANSKNGSKIKVVATIFPAYDWAKEVIGKNDADLTMLLSNGADLHSYQPSVQDIVKISESDVFIYVGGESDGWVKDALKNVRNKNIQVVNMMEVMGDRAKAEEVKRAWKLNTNMSTNMITTLNITMPTTTITMMTRKKRNLMNMFGFLCATPSF